VYILQHIFLEGIPGSPFFGDCMNDNGCNKSTMRGGRQEPKNCLVALLNCVQIFSWAGVEPTGPGHVKCRGLGERCFRYICHQESGIHGTPHYLNCCYLGSGINHVKLNLCSTYSSQRESGENFSLEKVGCPNSESKKNKKG
jgi:hypothetical protein